MKDNESLNHTKWDCKYHVVFIPKYRKKALFGALRKEFGPIFHELVRQKGSKIEERHIMIDHVHMLLSIPPKLSVSNVVGYLKGKSAIYIARNFRGRKKNFSGESLWARGYFVTTVGHDEETVRKYIINQGKNYKKKDDDNQADLFPDC
ncbi:MAG: IS200/IS605 family transposase [Lentisphaerales bacterium]|nr:IS200/IS605 family transposase [Lentisphaerales bacterium]